MRTRKDDIRIVDHSAAGRYEAYVGEHLAGIAEYRLAPGLVTFVHTKVDPAFEGQGVGGRLASWALDDARARGLSVRPICPFIAAFIRRHQEYADLVAGGAHAGS